MPIFEVFFQEQGAGSKVCCFRSSVDSLREASPSRLEVKTQEMESANMVLEVGGFNQRRSFRVWANGWISQHYNSMSSNLHQLLSKDNSPQSGQQSRLNNSSPSVGLEVGLN
ncbi:hypothetical protein FQN55_000652 [Onygenales sp. PD_40]|nr:hypothetical protein FQN55_000652 [Onygenales sp. PD_40]